MDKKRLFKELEYIIPQNVKNKPHKAIAFLSIIQGIEEGRYRKNCFYYDSTYKEIFSNLFYKYASNKDSNRPYTPFFHLKSTKFWNLIPKNGKEEVLENATSVGGPGKLQELVEYAIIDEEIFNLLCDSVVRKEIKDYLIKNLKSYQNPESSFNSSDKHDKDDPEPSKPEYRTTIQSKFPHEQQALETIHGSLHKYVELIPNYELHDPATNQYLECDLIVVSTDGIYIAELKHWTGEIVISSHFWTVRGGKREDPHRHNNYKCKVLKGVYQKHFSYLPNIWVKSVVVLTNPDAQVINADGYKTTKDNPTFNDLSAFSRYIKEQRKDTGANKLTKQQAEKVAQKLRELSQGKQEKGLFIPGYEILQNLTKSAERIELLAMRTDNQLQQVNRLRIFLPNIHLDSQAREEQRTRSLNSLKALSNLSDHPNLLKVWDIPHEDGLVIEASDWSPEGTLADVLKSGKHFSQKQALEIIRGIAEGLRLVHEQGMVHRHLTPENILMENNQPKLMNFDLSYLPDNLYTTMPDDIELEKSPYLAPELYYRDFTEASDVFSLGVISFRLLCGQQPFDHSLQLDQSNGELSGSARKILNDSVHDENLQTLMEIMIQADRKTRPQDAKEVIEYLETNLPQTLESPSPPPKPNQLLEPGEGENIYRIKALLGKGREAQIYHAVQSDEKDVVIKLFHQEIPSQRVTRIRKHLNQAAGPYVVRCETHLQWKDGRFFLVLDYIDGPSLRHQIDSKQKPDLKRFADVARKLMEALSGIHQLDLLHNDIKPDNILLTKANDPVIIDFGIAGSPGIGPYMGTDAYVAPDFFQDADYQFCVGSDLFSLGVTLFEWFCGEKPYPETPLKSKTPLEAERFRPDAPPGLLLWLNRAVAPLQADRFADIKAMQSEFEREFEPQPKSVEDIPPSPIAPEAGGAENKNRFVSYLNTLHNTTANNENALAESQAINPYFGSIHVPLPLTDLIFQKLTEENGSHVVLTGHAGDGKTTIALELYKRLKGIPMEDRLNEALGESESLSYQGRRLHIVKDMSELSGDDRSQKIQDALNDGTDRWLIISNTGTLLQTLKAVGKDKGIAGQRIEDDVLQRLESQKPSRLESFDQPLTIVNLTRISNIQAARTFLEKLIENRYWEDCEHCQIEKCPIYFNLRMLRDIKPRILERVGWVYRRLYEYGRRLTMRQISAHIAYSLTSGKDCTDIRKLAVSPNPPSMHHFLFCNRFFGFEGALPDSIGERIKAIQYLRPLEMGSRAFSLLDRRLWTQAREPLPDIPPELSDIAKDIERESHNQIPVSRQHQEIRRLYFLFGDFPRELEGFFPDFLDSPMLIPFEQWQTDPVKIESQKEDLRRKILRVLQERFTGFYMPEGRGKPGHSELFITLNRQNDALRQSVQLLQARYPLQNFILELKKMEEVPGQDRYELILKERFSGIELKLELPFLDFVMLRRAGKLDYRLDRGYLDRLERFKSRLLKQFQSDRSETELDLFEFTTDGRIGIQKIRLIQDELQASRGD